jgi:anti-sigma factor RsiW
VRLDRELACRDIVELVTAYLEDELDETDRERFEEHLVFCGGCAAFLDQMRSTVEATGRLELGGLPPSLQEQLLAAFRAWRPR